MRTMRVPGQAVDRPGRDFCFNMSKCHCQGKNVIVSLLLSKEQKKEEVCANKIFVLPGVIMEEALLIEISPLSWYICAVCTSP